MTIKTKTTSFQILWLLVIGGILIIMICFTEGIFLVKQGNEQLTKLGAEIFSFLLAALTLLRELAPVLVGLLLAFLAPVISILAYLGIKKTKLEDKEKSKILVSSKFISLIIAAVLLSILGSVVGIFSGFRESGANIQDLFRWLSAKDVLTLVIKSVAFGFALAIIGIFQIKQFFKKPNIIYTIFITILTIVIGCLTVILLDVGLTALFYRYGL